MVFLAAVLLAIAEAAISFEKLDTRWSIAFDAPPAGGTAFDESTAFVPLRSGELVAVDLERGLVRWRTSLSTTLTPAIGAGLVIAATADAIEAHDAATGEARWLTPLPGGVATPLYFQNGWLIASTPAGDLMAFRAADGSPVWRQAMGAALAVPPVAALDRLCLALADGRFLAVELASGRTVWSRDIPGRITGLLSLPEQLVFGTTENMVQSADVRTGRERWRWRVGGDVVGLPFADARRLYFVSRDNMVRAVDRKSGNLRWTAPIPSRPAGGPFMVQGAVLVPLVSNHIAGFDPVTGKAAVTIEAAGETSSQPYARQTARATSAKLITVSRDGQLQGFGLRFEPPPGKLHVPFGAPAVP